MYILQSKTNRIIKSHTVWESKKYKHNQSKKKKKKVFNVKNTRIYKLQFQTCSGYTIYTLTYNY